MRFKPAKRHRPPSVIIVSLIDVLLVVLIFIMVASTFEPRLQPALNISTWETDQSPIKIYAPSWRMPHAAILK
jgi:biopolymer transport protein ExbD